MPAKLFTPKHGMARWRIIHGLVSDMRIGQVITYEQLAAACFVDLADHNMRSKLQREARKASGKLNLARDRRLKVIPDIGYRILEHNMPAEDPGNGDPCPYCNHPLPEPKICQSASCGKVFFYSEKGRYSSIEAVRFCSKLCKSRETVRLSRLRKQASAAA